MDKYWAILLTKQLQSIVVSEPCRHVISCFCLYLIQLYNLRWIFGWSDHRLFSYDWLLTVRISPIITTILLPKRYVITAMLKLCKTRNLRQLPRSCKQWRLKCPSDPGNLPGTTLLSGFQSPVHYNDVIMGMMASRITSLTIVYSTVYSGANQRKHQRSASLAFVWGIHRGP